MVIGFELTLEAPDFTGTYMTNKGHIAISDIYIYDAAFEFIYQNIYLFN